MTGGDVPSGYDEICKWCESAYTYSNARSVGAKDWRHYCSGLCENHDTQHVTSARIRTNRRVTAILLADDVTKLVVNDE
jgi:hypothetical protein